MVTFVRPEDGQPYDADDFVPVLISVEDHEDRLLEVETIGALGYAQVTTAQTGVTAETDLTSLTVTVTVGTGRRIRVTGYGLIASSVAGDRYVMRIKESTTVLQQYISTVAAASTVQSTAVATGVLTPSAGTHTYKLSLQRASGTGTLSLTADSTSPGYILVEDIGAA